MTRRMKLIIEKYLRLSTQAPVSAGPDWSATCSHDNNRRTSFSQRHRRTSEKITTFICWSTSMDFDF